MILYLSLLCMFCAFWALHFKFSRYIPILMYHRIADIPGDRNALPVEKFREQLHYLKSNGFHTITLAMLYEHYTKGSALPPKSVLLTFDDGYKDNYEAALPLLLEYGLQAVIFPIGNWIGKENKWENFHKQPTTTMDFAELKKWQESGMDIASHTMNHPFLAYSSLDDISIELKDSKALLGKAFQRPVDWLCYPYGNFNKEVIAAAKSAGYKGALAIFDGVPLKRRNIFALPRIPIPRRQPLWEFKLKVSSIHMIFIILRQAERFFKIHLRKKKKS